MLGPAQKRALKVHLAHIEPAGDVGEREMWIARERLIDRGSGQCHWDRVALEAPKLAPVGLLLDERVYPAGWQAQDLCRLLEGMAARVDECPRVAAALYAGWTDAAGLPAACAVLGARR
jgi:hypothetical protein